MVQHRFCAQSAASAKKEVHSMFSKDIGIDLGTANTLVYMKGKGIIIREPSVVAVDTKTDKVKCVGQEAKDVIGRTPGSIVTVRPLKDGVIADFDVTTSMLTEFIHKAIGKGFFSRPRVVICIPSGVTAVERRAVRDAAEQAGAKRVSIIEEPMAAAIGAGLPVAEPLIGERTAENIKIQIGSACPLEDGELSMEIKGRNLLNGLPENITITSDQIRGALEDPLSQVLDAIRLTLERTPPELSADIIDQGITLTGGGALLRGLDKLIHDETGMPVKIAESPLDCVATGAGMVLDNIDTLTDVLSEDDTNHY